MLNRDTFLRELKGAPLAILLAVWVYGPLTQPQLSARTGYTSRTLRDSFGVLELYDLVGFVGGRYRLLDGARQLPLPFPVDNYAEKFSPTTTTTIDHDLGVAAAEAALAAENFSDLSTDVDKSLVLAALASAGIGSPVRDELAALAWVTPDYVADHVAFARKRRDGIGLVVHRLRCGDPAPRVRGGDIPPEYLDVIVR